MLALGKLGWDSWELGVILGYTTSSRTAWAIVRPCLLKRETSYSTGVSISETQNQIRRQTAERLTLHFPLAAVLECCGCYRHLVGFSRNTCMEPSGILDMELGFQNVGN